MTSTLHDTALDGILRLPGKSPITLPKEILAHQTIIGWALFEIDNELINGKCIEGYKINIFDSHGLEVNLDSIILQVRELNEKQMA